MEDSHPPATILVVDDEPYIVEMVTASLRYLGYTVATASCGRDALASIATTKPDLVILDVMLPDTLGFDLVPEVRAASEAPVLFLTARDAVEDRVRGFAVGGDDYVTKPFSLEELAGRVRAILRRTGSPAANAAVPRLLRYADLVLDEDGHEVWRHGEAIHLSPTEFSLLRFLLLNAEKVVSRAQILDHVWHYDFNGDATVVDSYIRYLRRRVDAVAPPLIETVRGVGYTLRLPRSLR